MTVIRYVTQKEMQRETGLRGALGYAFPQKDRILIRKGLTQAKKKEVLAHEEEHISKGEEGPFWGAVIGAGASLLGGALGSSSAKKARKAQEDAAAEQIGYARETRDLVRGDQAPYREAGYSALGQLMGLSGLPVPTTVASAAGGDLVTMEGGIPAPNQSRYMNDPVYRRAWDATLENHRGKFGVGYTKASDPSNLRRELLQRISQDKEYKQQQQQQQQTQQEAPQTIEEQVKADPSYEFRRDESMRALERGAAARGGLLSGGFGRQAIRYASDYASTEYGKIYDRIANIAGLGMTGAANSGNAALATGGVMANAASQAGYGRASGYVAQGNQWANTINELSKIDWGGVFGRTPPPSGGFKKSGGVGKN